MASTSIQKKLKYDSVFEFQRRKNFVDHLYHALHNRGVITFKDDEKIEKGERISDQLIRSIEESRFYIIVFSKKYASSSWCLDELVKIMEGQKMTEHTAYPVFYDVEPTEVRNQSGAVGEAFAKHVRGNWIFHLFERFTRKRKRMLEDPEKEDDIGRWIKALKQAADQAGMELKNTMDGHEAIFIQKLVEEISLKLHFINSSDDENLIGMETRVGNVVSSLEVGHDDVRMIGIKVMGGGGKTTLARAVFDHLSILFEGKSFVENVREVSKGSLSGLKQLQKQVLSDALNDPKIGVNSVSEGKVMMKRMIRIKKAPIVLDDMSDITQLEALAGHPSWFMPGSRIIITTRDEQVLRARRLNFIHDVSLLSDKEAIRLFSRYAFGGGLPNRGYEELSGEVLQYVAGLPLTIKILGSFMCGRPGHEWVDALERLKKIPLKETLEKLYMPVTLLKLKFLNLSGSKVSNLNLRLTPYLEKLTLSIKEIKHLLDSICMMKHLKYLNLKSCWLLEELPTNICGLECLEELHLTNCSVLQDIPNNICMLKHLKCLKLKSCLRLEQLPQDLDKLEFLEELYLIDCISLQDIPNKICDLEFLRFLHLPYCILIENLPMDLGRLKSLEELNIDGASIRQLPKSVYQMKGLRIVWSRGRLESCGFTSLTEISRYTASCYVSCE